MRKGDGTLDGGGGGEHSQTRCKIYLCTRLRVSAEAQFIQDKNEVSSRARNSVSRAVASKNL